MERNLQSAGHSPAVATAAKAGFTRRTRATSRSPSSSAIAVDSAKFTEALKLLREADLLHSRGCHAAHDRGRRGLLILEQILNAAAEVRRHG